MKALTSFLILSLSFCSALLAENEANARFLDKVEDIPLPKGIESYFSREGSLEDEVVRLIKGAETEIVFNAYVITSHKILNALMDSYVTRKIFIAGLLDPNPSVRRYTTPEYFSLNGLPFAYPKLETGYNNLSYMVIDKSIVITGSYQFTRDSQNYENLLVIYEPALAIQYYNHFVGVLDTSLMPTIKKDSNE